MSETNENKTQRQQLVQAIVKDIFQAILAFAWCVFISITLYETAAVIISFKAGLGLWFPLLAALYFICFALFFTIPLIYALACILCVFRQFAEYRDLLGEGAEDGE